MTATMIAPAEQVETAAAHVDTILRTSLKDVTPTITRVYGAAQSKAIRDLFRDLGWGKFFRVTKGCWSLGSSIEWAKGFQPEWYCPRVMALRAERGNGSWFDIPVCCCETCKHRQSQRDAISRRVHHALNVRFHTGREFGNRSDSQSDYFDSDYTFHA